MNVESPRRPFGWTRPAALLSVILVLGLGSAGCAASPRPSSSVLPSLISGMVVTNAQARLMAAGGPISVTATITNATGADDWLVGGSSPAASTGGIYATCACGTSAETGLAGKSPMPSWLIASTQAIELRSGAGEMLLVGLTQPVSGGQTIPVTFKFTHAPPTTVDVVVASSLG
jgi:copper(I)-binding protein